jgi:hypothetical protein
MLAALLVVPAALPAPVAAAGPQIAQQAYAKASNTGAGDKFGSSVAVYGNTMVVGAPYEASAATGINGDQTSNVQMDAGATWIQQAYLKASNTGTFAMFGWVVAIAGDTIVVGSPEESGSATGVNGGQTQQVATYAGAAYIFVRSAGAWSQQAYLKASNTETDDTFGRAVAVSGATVVAGAPNESSPATGINGAQASNSATNSGAAYVFYRSPIATTTTLAGPASVKLGATLKITGTVSPSTAPGTVSIGRYRLVSGKWKLIGTKVVTLVAGKFGYAIKLPTRGKWRFVAAYSGGSSGWATNAASKSASKAVTVK